MKNLSNFEAFKLNKEQMNAIAGGINAEEYCNGIYANYQANKDKWDSDTKSAFAVGWSNAKCEKYIPDHGICF